MAEKEYVERGEAKRVMKANDWLNPAIPNVVNVILDRLPAADVVEVVHARWEKIYDEPLVNKYRCTNCKAEKMRDNYCPNCGAKMKGERKE